jgi:hypothetical protein
MCLADGVNGGFTPDHSRIEHCRGGLWAARRVIYTKPANATFNAGTFVAVAQPVPGLAPMMPIPMGFMVMVS